MGRAGRGALPGAGRRASSGTSCASGLAAPAADATRCADPRCRRAARGTGRAAHGRGRHDPAGGARRRGDRRPPRDGRSAPSPTEARLGAMPVTSSCCPPSTSPTARPSGWSRAWPAPRSAYGDPLEAALPGRTAGAEWIHLVDLDAAFGRGHNRELLAAIVGRLDVEVELTGGIRDDESLAAALATGCRRVNIGTAALEDPEWCAGAIAEHGDRVAVGLDVRGRRWPPAAGPARAATCTRCWPGSTPRAAPATSSPTSTRTACCRARTSSCCATSAPPPTGRWSPAGASPARRPRALAGLVRDGVEGAIVGKALYAGRSRSRTRCALTRGGAA